jgi:hypothetical protein
MYYLEYSYPLKSHGTLADAPQRESVIQFYRQKYASALLCLNRTHIQGIFGGI